MANNNGAAAAPAREPAWNQEDTVTRQKRLAELQARIARGEYQVDSRELAVKLLRAHLRQSRES